MVERGKRLDPHLRVALQTGFPNADVLVNHLVIAPAVQNQDRHVESARDRDFIARVEVVVVQRGRAKKILRKRHLVRRDLVGLPLELREFFRRRLSDITHLLNDHGWQLAAVRREHHDSGNRPRLPADFRRNQRAKAVADDEDSVMGHL